MDAFFASIEQAVNPRLKGKPLIVGSRANKNYTIVCAASYEAKAYGIDSGISTKEAFKLCPQALFVAADTNKYIYTSEGILKLLREYGLPLEYASVDEFRMDLADLNMVEYGDLVREIKQKIRQRFGITCSIGIARNFLLAKLASKINKPDGLVILTGENLLKALTNLGVEKLCGVGPSTQIVLNNLGVKTCLELWNIERETLTRHLGQRGLALYMALHSQETLGFSQGNQTPKSIGHSYTLPRAVQDLELINAWIRLLSEMVAFRLRDANLEAKITCIWLVEASKKTCFSAQKASKLPTNDGFEVFLRARRLMAKLSLAKPKIRAIGVSCSSLVMPKNRPLFKEIQKREDLLKTLDNIKKKHGEWSIYPASLLLTATSGQSLPKVDR